MEAGHEQVYFFQDPALKKTSFRNAFPEKLCPVFLAALDFKGISVSNGVQLIIRALRANFEQVARRKRNDESRIQRGVCAL